MPIPSSRFGNVFKYPLEATSAVLTELATELDFTNKELAHYAGVRESTVYRWLNGSSPIPMSVIRMLYLMVYVLQGQKMIKVAWAEPGAVA